MSSVTTYGSTEPLIPLGWSPVFDRSYRNWLAAQAAHGDESARRHPVARVAGEERGLYRLQLDAETTLWGELSGRLRHDALGREEIPAVGDWVVCEPFADARGGSRAVIHALLERRGCLKRKAAGRSGEDQLLAANVDVAFIVTSANSDLNPRRLERYLTLAWDGGARPIVVLAKAELARDLPALVSRAEGAAPGVEVIALSVHAGTGIEAMEARLGPGVTAVLLGSSGVGKSTLANRLLGREELRVQAIRESDGRGRHTTTSRQLFALACGALLIDTPGMRELQLGAQESGLSRAYSDIEAIAARCRFNDCGHGTEPGCRIRGALESGELDAGRWEGFLKLEREVSFQLRKEDKAEESRQRDAWKKVTQQARAHMRRKRWER